MSKYLLLGVLIVAVAVGTYLGCGGARIGVAKDKVIKQIDKVLGELNVKRKEVQITYDKIQDGYQTLREKRIEATILKDRFQNEISDLDSDQAALMQNLQKLKPLLEEAQSSGAVTKNGKEVTLAQLKMVADKTIKDIQRNKEKIAHKKKMAAISDKNLATLAATEDASKKQLAKLRDDIETIDSKKEMLDSMKTDASLLSGGGASINDEFDKLSKDVAELMLKVDTQVALEEAKLEDRISELSTQPTSIDELFSDDTDVSGTLGSIDELLKGEGGE